MPTSMMMEEKKTRRLGLGAQNQVEKTRPVSPLQRENMHLARSPDNKLEAIQATCMSATPYRCLEPRAAAGVQGQRQFRR